MFLLNPLKFAPSYPYTLRRTGRIMKNNTAQKTAPQTPVTKLGGHEHIHSALCGHKSYVHGDHVDYFHDGHYHFVVDGVTYPCGGPGTAAPVLPKKAKVLNFDPSKKKAK